MNDTAVAVQKTKALVDPVTREMFERLKLMITNGKKLSNDEAAALAQFAVQENLSPFNHECWYIPAVGPAIGIQGLRKKAQEKLSPGHYFKVVFYDVTEEYNKNDPTIGYAFRAVLKDTETSAKYLSMKVEYLNSGVKEDEIVDVLGDKPEWEAVGFWSLKERNDLKDKFFLPEERAKKRAEALVIKKRFNLSYDRVSEESNPDVSVEQPVQLEGGVVEGSFDEGPEIDDQFDTDFKSPAQVRLYVQGITEDLKSTGDVKPVTDGQKGVILSALQYATAPGDTTIKRHIFTKFIFDVSSSKELTDEQWRALAKYMDIENIDTGEYRPKDPITIKEINNLIAFAETNEKQPELL